MDDNKFWITIWALIAALVMVIVIGITAAVINEDNIKKSLIEQDHTPAQLVCAFNPPQDYLAKATICGVQNQS